MKAKALKIKVSPTIGSVSAIAIVPPKARAILTLAHGAGAGMEHSFMNNLSEALAAAGIGTLRFNFPFSEQQKKRPDTPAVAHQTIAAAIDKARELYPSLPLFVAGKSFGGRMSSQYMATNHRTDVEGLIFYGFPLHAAGKPSTDRAEHLKEVKVPMLFLQGTRDTLATWDLIEPVCKSLKKTTLVKLEGADHSFKAGKTDTIALLVEATKEWV
ncbi:alpha/beta hydrolase [Chitinophaga horti]|uniref:Alpha/beta hydrolase n=1 Tax=Chitinophaga horti TaxID=2920382 RepID=A0ABY6IXM6_9BACT|nr:alpha/beta family hydrolase [Chitinophaga horti]UYQ91162.1 alpha/beta hydrolase [Chitinophaga horti]